MKKKKHLWIDEEEKVGHAKEREKDEGGSDCPSHLHFGDVPEKSGILYFYLYLFLFLYLFFYLYVFRICMT